MSHLMPTLPGDVSRILLFLKAVRYERHEEILPEFLLTVKNLSFAPGGPIWIPGSYVSSSCWIPESHTPWTGRKWLISEGFFQRCRIRHDPHGKPLKTSCYVKIGQLRPWNPI